MIIGLILMFAGFGAVATIIWACIKLEEDMDRDKEELDDN